MRVTPAEERALEAMLRHGTIKEAAASMGKSPSTVNNQLAAARGRANVGTTIELVRIVFVERG